MHMSVKCISYYSVVIFWSMFLINNAVCKSISYVNVIYIYIVHANEAEISSFITTL